MADKKITQFSALTAVADEDELVIVDNPSGSAETKKITRADLVGSEDITIETGKKLKTDTISETTADNGVSVDSVVLKDGNIESIGATALAVKTNSITRFNVASSGEITTASNPAFMAYGNSGQSIGDGAVIEVIFGTEQGDRASNYGTATGRFTAPVSAYYHFDWAMVMAQNTSYAWGDYFQSAIRINSGTASGSQWYSDRFTANSASTNILPYVSGAATLYLTAGQYVSIWASQSSGTTQTLSTTTNCDCWFSGHIVG